MNNDKKIKINKVGKGSAGRWPRLSK